MIKSLPSQYCPTPIPSWTHPVQSQSQKNDSHSRVVVLFFFNLSVTVKKTEQKGSPLLLKLYLLIGREESVKAVCVVPSEVQHDLFSFPDVQSQVVS